MRRTDPLIVGGGPAGAATAILLARAGARPRLIERSDREHDVVCGGFLGWDALARLDRLGLDAAALGARPIARLRLVAGSRSVETRLPHRAAGLSRRRLDATLLDLAAAAGARIDRGIGARAFEDGRLRLDDGTELQADSLFLATGKHELRGLARPVDRSSSSPAAGLRTLLPPSLALERALAGYIELHLFDSGYAGLLVEEDGINLCLSVSRDRLAAAGSPSALLAGLAGEAPRLAERIGAVTPRWEAVAGVPYGWRARDTAPGLFRGGDQAAVIASLAGDGIAIALASGEAAARSCLSGGPAAAPRFQSDFAGRARRPILVGEVLRHAAESRLTRTGLLAAARIAPGLARLASRLTRIG